MARRILAAFVLCLFSAYLGVRPASSQVTNITDDTITPIPGSGHDYIRMLSETVNPANGGVSLRIELPVPKSRGFTIPFSIAYDSNNVHHLVGGNGAPWGFAVWKSNTSILGQGGWTFAVPQLSLSRWSVFHDDLSALFSCYFASNYIFLDKIGTTHALGVGSYTGDGDSNYYCNGYSSSYAQGGDGKVRATLTTQNDNGEEPNGSLQYEPSVAVSDDMGTVYSFTIGYGDDNDNGTYVLPTSIEDRNGNTAYFALDGSKALTVTDSSGRTSISTNGFGPSGATNTIVVSGETFQVTWRTVSANFSTPATDLRGGHPDWACSPPPATNDSRAVISQIALPNQRSYHFYYGTDVTPHGAPSNPYGLLSEIDYPSGAWVTYSWKEDTFNELADYPGSENCSPGNESGCFQPLPDGCLYHYMNPVVASRTVSFGGSSPVLTQTFDYSTSWASSGGIYPGTLWTTKTTNVTTTDNVTGKSSLTTYVYKPLGVPLAPYTESAYPVAQVAVEQTISYYNWQDQGATLLHKVDKDWLDQFDLTLDQETVYPSQKSSKKTYTYLSNNGFNELQEWDDYDFGQGGTGPLTRKEIVNYQSFPTTALGASISGRPSSIVTYDANGSTMGETDYAYDQFQVSEVSAAGHDDDRYSSNNNDRGNATTKTVKCLQSCANAVTTYTYDKTGQVTTMTDPCGNGNCSDMPSGVSHTTQYSYADSYSSCDGAAPPSGNTNAYLTKITNPKGQMEWFCYGYDDGQLRRSTDPNGQFTNYQYNDSLRRLKETDYPDGGQTTFCYTDVGGPTCPLSGLPYKVVSTRSVTSGVLLTTTTVYDGVGHVTQSQLNSDPQGVTYADTTYDGEGRAWQQSNPYRSTSDPTYGITQTGYDPLGRTLSVVKPDGSATSMSYSGNTTTVTDEAGNQRRSITDALGRLIEVDEPGTASGAPATPGTGSFTVSGAEQSTVVGPPTAGHGSVTLSGTLQSWQTQTAPATPGTGSTTISGAAQSKQTQPGTSGSATVTINGAPGHKIVLPSGCRARSCSITVYDYGTIVVTVNGFAALAQYANGSTGSSVAAALANSFNGNSASPVTASSTNNVLTLVAKSTGSSSNYSLSAVTSSWNTTYFSSPTMSPTASSSTLLGGTNPTYVYDSGHCWVTVNGQQINGPTWSGSGTTTTSIASALASAQSSSSSYVTGSPSGAVVSLTTRQTGASTNYPLSSGCTYDSSNFSGPSFTTSNSGSALTGGHDAQYQPTYDSGMTTVTVNGHATPYSWSGASTTSSTIASGVAQAINSDGSAWVNANATGTTVNLTARTAGAGTNYSLSASTTSQRSSFSSVPSGSNLVGGSPGTPLYDSGTVQVTVGSFTATANYNSGSTASSVASALASAFAGSGISASAAGTTVTLTTVQTGSSANLPLSGTAATSQPSNFSGPSFVAATSGASLSGGTDAGPANLGSPAVTLYGYDALNNLTCVVQKGTDTTAFTASLATCPTAPATWRPRWFSYNSLSELVTAHNPESGAINYAYDPNGNVTSKTDARGVITNYTYDELNRLTQKSYQNDPSNTATVKYGYDGVAGAVNCPPTLSVSNPIGRLTSMCDAAGTESWSYPMVVGTGWQTIDKRITNGITGQITTQSNLDGSTASITYPSGRVVSYTVGSAGRPLSAQDSGHSINYVSNATYAPFGGLAGMTNGGVITTSDSYNKRLQPAVLSVATSGNTILSRSYDFHPGADNGNVYQIVNNVSGDRTQNFRYDALNRITEAWTSGPLWGERFTIDLWGNLTNRDSVPGKTNYESLAAPASTQNRLNGYGYDAAGNLIQNGSASYVYDAESRLKTTAGLTYTYDGDGNRVMKSNGTVGTLYWGAGPLAETDLSGNNEKDYVFFNGRRVARLDLSNSSVHHYFSDHLGSHSVVTNASGACEQDIDYYPYGGVQTDYCPTLSQNYKFTGKERDSENGLDYFGARYYASTMSRFMTPDWSRDPGPVPYADYENPQTLNLYQYGENNPLNATDPDGHRLVCHTKIGTPDANGKITVNLDCHEEPDLSLLQQYEQAKRDFTDRWHKRIDAHQPPPQKPSSLDPLQYINNVMMGMVAVGPSPRFGWRNGVKWRQAIKDLMKPGTHKTIAGEVPTRAEATEMIEQGGGQITRGGSGQPMDPGEEFGHEAGGQSEHTYPHINYDTASGVKATVKVQP